MAATRSQGRRKSAYGGSRNEYIYGNTARALRPVEIEAPPSRKLSNTARKNRDKAAHMNPAYVVFLTLAMLVTGYVCIQYLQLQSDITNSTKKISQLEIQLNNLKAENDDTESRIKGAVDLEEIKRRAMEELGMQYAREDQIVTYEGDDTDYVRQYADIEN